MTGRDGNLWFTENNLGQIGQITPGGVVTEFPLPSGPGSLPQGITAGPDGNLWVAEFGGNKIGVISTAGVAVAEFPVPTANGGPSGIAAGPGGIWFTENNGNKIGRITVAAGVGISPPSGLYGVTQRFDLVLLILEAPGRAVVGGNVTVDGADVTVPLVACIDGHVDTFDGETGLVARCPGLTFGLLGTGSHTVTAMVAFSDGSSASATVTWTILP
ncbi:MAG TPA: hypothetical protein VGX21_15410 [Methylomirabilota bacterium]|nr:hypothetical protein [Methylomirabilota bacterium]